MKTMPCDGCGRSVVWVEHDPALPRYCGRCIPAITSRCPCGTLLSAHEKTTGAGDCFGCRAAARKGGAE